MPVRSVLLVLASSESLRGSDQVSYHELEQVK
jgi:hypothetical protein